MQAHGLGRCAIDLPVGFLLEPGSFAKLDYTIDSQPITVMVTLMGAGIHRVQFERSLHWRVVDLSNDTHVELQVPMLIEKVRLGDAWLMRAYEDRVRAELISSEVHLLLDDLHIKVSATSHESKVAETEEQLKFVALQLLHKTPDPAAAGSGCSLGPVLIAGDVDRERTWLRFSNRTTPGVEWTVFGTSTDNAGAQDQPLGRWEELRMTAGLNDEQADMLLSSYFRVPGKESQEILTRQGDGNEGSLLFFGETRVGLPGLPTPRVSLRLAARYGHSGRSGRLLWSEDKALNLWHAVLVSIRSRTRGSPSYQKSMRQPL